MQPGQIIGLDVGQKRTGIARASLIARLAEPLATVATEDLPEKLEETLKEYKPEAVVVGLPRGLSGQETGQTEWVRAYIESLKEKFPSTAFYLQDEALTTIAAAGVKKNTDVDAVAASIILQDYLNEQERK